MGALRRLLFRLLGKEPEAVIVCFASGPLDLARTMVEQIRLLEPARRIFAVSLDAGFQVEGCTTVGLKPEDLYGQLRREFRGFRVGLAPVLFAGGPHPLRAAAFLLAPRKILAHNARLERHHLRLSTWIASWLFLRGVPLDRIWLRPRWLWPWKKDRTRVASKYRVIEGRPESEHRRKIGILTPYFPWPLSHGGAVRIFHLLREAAREFDVHLFAFSEPVSGADIEPVRQLAARIVLMEMPRYREPRWASLDPPEVCEFRSPAMKRLIREARGLDLLQVEYTHLATYGGDVLVEHDVTWDLYSQVHAQRRTLSSWWDQWRWRRFESRAVRRFRRVVAMSEKDRALLGGSHVRVIPNGVDLDRFQPSPEPAARNLLFVGSFRHFPNILAFRFLIEEVWPLIEERFPEMRLAVVAGPDPLIHWKAATDAPAPQSSDRICFHGFVGDVKPLYDEATVVVVPTPVSAGTNLKVLEAMAMLRAVVSTRCGCEGLGLIDRESVWIADDAAGFAAGIATLLEDPALRARLAVRAREIAEREFGWRGLAARQRALWHEMLPRRLHIRVAGNGDLEFVLRIQRDSPGAAQWEPSAYLPYQFYIAEWDRTPAGFIVWRSTGPEEAEIMNVAVAPEFRRRSVATHLLDFARTHADGPLFLEVRGSNLAALALYRNYGFREAGIRKEYYSDPVEDAIVMRL